MDFLINKRKINNFYKPYIIAEACINHEGDISTAKEMINQAKMAGADCIKFQIHNLENEMLKVTPQSDNFDESLWDALERTNFDINQQQILKSFCEQIKIDYLCTPFSRIGADQLESIGVNCFKVGSGELTNLPLIEHIAKKKIPMIVSTGMSEMKEIEETVDLIKKIGTPLALTHCVSIYPCDYEYVNLRVIDKLQKQFNVPVGLSDHSNDIFSSLGAVARGACIIEKHFTLNKKSKGPDHASSIEPEELKQLVIAADAIFKCNGDIKKIHEKEKQIIAWARESVVTEKEIKKGEVFSRDNIWVKRPAPGQHGIAAKYYNDIIGKKSKINLKSDVQLKWVDVEK